MRCDVMIDKVMGRFRSAVLFQISGACDHNAANITPRYTMDEIQTAVAPLQARIAQPEAENPALRAGAAYAG